ncbi:hypothetical protein ALC53_04383 [Atta colombica]|uniref:Uncharacterized protein n=1 Tax=Atta colombica TaxID=520822 RepID=A0A195BLK7_9HYME|nr:hypothetical protein ALC53_04383 [Atta colombica]
MMLSCTLRDTKNERNIGPLTVSVCTLNDATLVRLNSSSVRITNTETTRTHRSYIRIRGFMNIQNSQMIRAERRWDREEREILDVWLDEDLYLAELFGLQPYEPDPEPKDWNYKRRTVASVIDNKNNGKSMANHCVNVENIIEYTRCVKKKETLFNITYVYSIEHRAVCLLSRRYDLTAMGYKFLEIGINVGPSSYVKIVGDHRGHEVSVCTLNDSENAMRDSGIFNTHQLVDCELL